MKRRIFPRKIYKAFKGKLYRVMPSDCRTYRNKRKKFVIYQALGERKIYAGPYDMFASEVKTTR